MAGIATRESLIAAFGQKALNKDGFLFPRVCGPWQDREPVDAVRNRMPIIFPTDMADFTSPILTESGTGFYTSVVSGPRNTYIDLGNDELADGVAVDQAVGRMTRILFMDWDKKVISLWNANGVGFDGQAYFLATHNKNGSTNAAGTQSNLISSTTAVVAAATPTIAEAAAILDEAVDTLLTMVDPNGVLVNAGMTNVTIVCGTAAHSRAFKSAIHAFNGTVEASANAALKEIKFDVTIQPTLTTNDVLFNNSSADGRAICLVETRPEMIMDPANGRFPKNKFSYRADRGYGLGIYWYVVKASLTTK